MIATIAGRTGAMGQAALRLWTHVGTCLGPLGAGEMADVAASLAIDVARADRTVQRAITLDAKANSCQIVPLSFGSEGFYVGGIKQDLLPEAKDMIAAIRKATAVGNARFEGYAPGFLREPDGTVEGLRRAAAFLRSRGYARDAEATALETLWRLGA